MTPFPEKNHTKQVHFCLIFLGNFTCGQNMYFALYIVSLYYKGIPLKMQ